jgi:hypothetical protein
MSSLYYRIEKLRRPGESNREFAARIGVLHPILAKWKREAATGKTSKPRAETLATIAKKTGVDYNWLLWGDE